MKLRGMNLDALRDGAALVELCEHGLLTCTRGEPGQLGSTYAVAWFPLDNPENYSEDVRQLHAENMQRVLSQVADDE